MLCRALQRFTGKPGVSVTVEQLHERWIELAGKMESPDVILLVEQIIRSDHTRLTQYGQPMRQFWGEVADWFNHSQSRMRHSGNGGPTSMEWSRLNGCLAAAYSYMDNHVQTTSKENPCRYLKCPIHEHEDT